MAANDGDTTPLSEYVPNNDNWLFASSRNNWVDYHVYLLVKKIRPFGVSYLSKGFEGKRCISEGWVATALNDQYLSQAIEGLRYVLANFPRDIDMATEILDNAYVTNADIALLESTPSSIDDALARYRYHRSAGDGDDGATLIAFLQGHLSVLEFASDHSMSALYVVYLS